MEERTVDSYIEAIKAQYEKAKTGPYTTYLIRPSPAQLRELCFDILRQNKNNNDALVFRNFWEISFKEEEIRAITNSIDITRLIPIQRFYLGSTTPADLITIEMAALLVDFPERPYRKFINAPPEPPKPPNGSGTGTTDPPKTGGGSTQGNKGRNTTAGTDQTDIIQSLKNKLQAIWNTITRFFRKRQLSKIHYGLATVAIMGLLVWNMNKTVFTPKNCMVWMEDHYEKIDCNDPEINGYSVKLDEELLEHFRKVSYSDTLTFFNLYGKPLIWYSKSNGVYELFTYHGLHPVTEKTLKPITYTIINNLNSNPNQ
ncbi:hypothetical protein [Flavobacterium sp. CAU 1735]|uniref:hypothetical protein n=1 Tax=Flavobacterium sp. CAU 1735 TaxID=3140361 RepID=UPI0032617A64